MKKTDTNLPQAAAPADPFVTIAFIHDRTGPQTSGIEEGMRTDESRPTVTGTSTPNQRVMLYDGDRLIGSVQANSSGYWVFNFPFGEFLAPGDHQLSAKIPGATSDTTSFTVDPQAKYNLLIDFFYPQANPSLMLGESSIISEIAVRGRTKPGELVEIYDGDKLVGSGYANGAGEYHIAINEPLSVGAHTLRAKSASGQSVDKLYTLTPPPPADYLEITAVKDEKGQPVAEGEANLTRCPTFFGKTLPFTSVEIWDDAQLLGSAMSNFHGEWRFDVRQPLAGGTHTIAAKTAEGSSTFTLITDAPPAPAVPVIEQVFDDVGAETGALTMGAETDDRQPQLLGTAEPNRLVGIYDNERLIGLTMTDARGEWQFMPTVPLAAGAHSLTVGYAYPHATQSEPFPITVTEPQIARPVITALYDDVGSEQGIIGNGKSTDDRKPLLSGTAPAGSWINIMDNGKAIGYVQANSSGEWQFTVPSSLTLGEHRFTLKIDSVESEPYTVTVTSSVKDEWLITGAYDSVGAETGLVINGGTTDDRYPEFTGRAPAYSFVQVHSERGLVAYAWADEKGEWRAKANFPLPRGEIAFVMEAENKHSELFTLKIVGEPLALVLDKVYHGDIIDSVTLIEEGATTSPGYFYLLGKGDPGSVVNIFDGATLAAAVTVDSFGFWQLDKSILMVSEGGNHTLSIAYADGSQRVEFDVTIDDSLSLMNVLQQPEELLLMEAVALDDDALLPLQISDGELRQQPESLAGPAGTPVVSPMLEEEALNPHAVNSY